MVDATAEGMPPCVNREAFGKNGCDCRRVPSRFAAFPGAPAPDISRSSRNDSSGNVGSGAARRLACPGGGHQGGRLRPLHRRLGRHGRLDAERRRAGRRRDQRQGRDHRSEGRAGEARRRGQERARRADHAGVPGQGEGRRGPRADQHRRRRQLHPLRQRAEGAGDHQRLGRREGERVLRPVSRELHLPHRRRRPAPDRARRSRRRSTSASTPSPRCSATTPTTARAAAPSSRRRWPSGT